MTEPFTLKIESAEGGVIIRLIGDAAAAQIESLRKGLHSVLERDPSCVVLDLHKLEFINSLGLGVLLEFRKKLYERGAVLKLAGAVESVSEIFKKTRLVELFPMFESADQALDAS